MGTPRESIRLVERDGRLRLLTVKTGVDHTASMTRLCRADAPPRSPADGSVRLRAEEGLAELRHDAGQGLRRQRTGAANRRRPVSRRRCSRGFRICRSRKKGGCSIRGLRENFIERVFAYRRLRDLFEGALDASATWSRFHTAHKLSLLAHSTVAYTRLGRLVAGSEDR